MSSDSQTKSLFHLGLSSVCIDTQDSVWGVGCLLG